MTGIGGGAGRGSGNFRRLARTMHGSAHRVGKGGTGMRRTTGTVRWTGARGREGRARVRARARPAAAAAGLVAALLLGACGGSGGGDEPTTAADAVFPDAPDGGSAIDASGGDADAFGGYVTAPGVEVCSVDDVKARVDFDMRDYYVFADRVPSLSPAGFDAPDALIRALRVAPDTFSAVIDFADFEAQTEGRNVGFGFRLAEHAAGRTRFQLVVGGSPAAAAGLRRGDELVALDGESVEALSPRDVGARLDDVPEGRTVAFTVRRDGGPDGGPVTIDVDVTRAEYVTDTVAGAFSFDAADGTRVGYVPVLQFASGTADSLDAAFASLAADGVGALVLDLRYNRGGLISAANRLAAHVAGDAVAGGTFVRYLHNAAYARERNRDVAFETVDATLGLERVVIVTTGESASSAELAINGLRPYVDVRTVGSATFGKAFGSRPLRHCDAAINAMLFVTANADGDSVAGGIAPDCAVADAWDHPLGDPRDALSGAAYALLLDGACPEGAEERVPLASRAAEPDAGRPAWDEAPVAPAMIDGG